MKNPFFKQTKHYQVELQGDLLMVRNSDGGLLKAMTVPVWNAVEKFNEIVEKIKRTESKK
jgi:hypothetical protein